MIQYMRKLVELKRDEKGVTALEYGLIAALIAVVIITAVTNLGNNLSNTFTNIGNHFSSDVNAGRTTAK